ncbi:flagellar FlbD family protein [bacterium]|nr:flagellar FlbD family protein [bacterium]
MIQVTRLNNTKFVINADLIEIIEALPDTTITLTTGKKFVVKESIEEIMRKIINYRKAIYGVLEEY